MAQPDRPSFREASAIVPALEAAFMNFEAVEQRLVEAMGVLRRSPDREWSWLHPGTLAMFRQYRPDIMEADDQPMRTIALTRVEEDRANEAMGWIVAVVPAGIARRIMGIALAQLAGGDRARVEWPAVRKRLGREGAKMTTSAVRMRYNRSITAIANHENARSLAG
ncbi:hypothetical protein O4H52_03135 [Sphingomonadaceae bacterium G21617-S1]|nr:hypothetical protein [Sphingomonadaceae bacterium G21617-S1]